MKSPHRSNCKRRFTYGFLEPILLGSPELWEISFDFLRNPDPLYVWVTLLCIASSVGFSCSSVAVSFLCAPDLFFTYVARTQFVSVYRVNKRALLKALFAY